MIEGPHISAFSPVALCINLTSALASVRLVSSVSASINAATLSLVGLVLLSVIVPAFRLFRRLTQSEERRNSLRCTRSVWEAQQELHSATETSIDQGEYKKGHREARTPGI